MNKIFYLVILLSVSLCGWAQEINNYKVEVGQFDRVKVCDNVNVVYRCLPDSSGFIQYRGDKQFADAFIITPKNGNLKIQVSTEDVGHPDLPTLYIYSDFLTGVENASNFNFTVENPAACAEFKVTQVGNGSVRVENVKANKVIAGVATGNGSVNVSGTCKEAVLKMVGTGTISADRLEADVVQCKILGSGSIGCWPLQKLNVKGIGSTKVYYKGDPQVKKSGGGKLYPLPEGRTSGSYMEGNDSTKEESASQSEDDEDDGEDDDDDDDDDDE